MSKDYVVRGGQELLVKKAGEPSSAWRWWTNKAVTYLSPEELVSSPETDPNEKHWTFKRGNWLLSVRSDQFYSPPRGVHETLLRFLIRNEVKSFIDFKRKV